MASVPNFVPLRVIKYCQCNRISFPFFTIYYIWTLSWTQPYLHLIPQLKLCTRIYSPFETCQCCWSECFKNFHGKVGQLSLVNIKQWWCKYEQVFSTKYVSIKNMLIHTKSICLYFLTYWLFSMYMSHDIKGNSNREPMTSIQYNDVETPRAIRPMACNLWR